jgi:RNA polymerase sigma-70 factor (ECF subfamily)
LESKAFRELALAEIDSVFRMAMHLSRREDVANDLVQETFLRAFKAENTFELREAGVRPWLFKILHNSFYTYVGKRNREPTVADDMQHEGVASEIDNPAPAWDLASLDWEQVDERLKAAIDGLPDHYREVLLLWAIEGLKYREVADVLDVPLGTVMSRLYRARAILSEQLAELAAESGIHVNGNDASVDQES